MNRITQRILDEIRTTLQHPFEGITITSRLTVPRMFLCDITGPPNSPFAGGIFKVRFTFPPQYPTKPPVIQFLTITYHANIDKDGLVHMKLLEEDWNPQITLLQILRALRRLLLNPELDHPLTKHLWKTDLSTAKFIANQFTARYAKP